MLSTSSFSFKVFKSSDSSLVTYYRPISISPQITKIFESIIFYNLRPKLNHILIPWQHGFRAGKSTITCSVYSLPLFMTSLSKGSQVDIIFIDFSKAFDTVPHNLLIKELDRICLCSVHTYLIANNLLS